MPIDAYCELNERRTGRSRALPVRQVAAMDVVPYEPVQLPDNSPEAIDVSEHNSVDAMIENMKQEGRFNACVR